MGGSMVMVGSSGGGESGGWMGCGRGGDCRGMNVLAFLRLICSIGSIVKWIMLRLRFVSFYHNLFGFVFIILFIFLFLNNLIVFIAFNFGASYLISLSFS
jgi:hypothetical protein